MRALIALNSSLSDKFQFPPALSLVLQSKMAATIGPLVQCQTDAKRATYRMRARKVVEKPVEKPKKAYTGKPRGRKPGQKNKKREATGKPFKKMPDHLKKKYVPTGLPRGRKPGSGGPGPGQLMKQIVKTAGWQKD